MQKITSRELNERKHFDIYAKSYDKNYRYSDGFTRYKIVKKSQDLKKLIQSQFGNSAIKMLEIGCGTGEYTKRIADFFPKSKIVGIDISPKILQIAKKKCAKNKNVSFSPRSAYSTKFKDRSVDVIFGYYILHHIDIDKFLKEARRILKPGGLIYFYEPNILNPAVYIIKSSKYLKSKIGDSPDEWAINPLEIRKQLTGFGNVSVITTEYTWPVRFLPAKVMVSIDKLFEMFKFVPLIQYFGGSVRISARYLGNLKGLEAKHDSEIKFHDNLAEKTKLSSLNIGGIFKSSTAPESQFALSVMTPLEGKKVLDLGCGAGEAAVYLAKHGAQVHAVDISPKMVGIVKRLTIQKRLKSKLFSKVMAAEKLEYPANYFDYVFGRGVLHHVDIGPTLLEVKRVLKVGGRAIFIEPLSNNPVINVYRKIAKEVRSEYETPIDYFKVESLNKPKFKNFKHVEFQLSTLLVLLWFFVVQRVSPNKERYWDKLINDEKAVMKPFSLLKSIDDYIFKTFPALRAYAWYTVMVFKK